MGKGGGKVREGEKGGGTAGEREKNGFCWGHQTIFGGDERWHRGGEAPGKEATIWGGGDF